MKLNRILLLTSASAALMAGQAMAAGDTVTVVDGRFDTAGSMIAYTEFELSGEPMAESLGLDLDVLDPNTLNEPSAFDYAAGIESYEYSEEAMYAVNYQSKLGPHLANGPLNATRGGTLESLGNRFMELTRSVGFSADELPLNLYPVTLPYAAGVPEYAGPVDTSQVSSDEAEVTTAAGTAKSLKTVVPAYYRDYGSLAWREDGMDKAFTPAATGAEMLKDVMWSQDFLGGMHVIDTDEEVEADSATMDQDGKHALGVSAADGVNGVVLTEITWDKLLTLRDELAYDGKKLGAALGPDYDPKKSPVWFPARIDVTEAQKNGVKAIGSLKVADDASTLRNTWALLWPLSEAYAYTDQRAANPNANPAFRAVFDGAPFAAAPEANTNDNPADDVKANDPFSLVSTLVSAEFKNLDTLHFNAKAGTFVDGWKDGKQSDSVTTYDAAYTLVALQIFERAQDALPVGYASGDSADGITTEAGTRALDLIKAEADFILTKAIGKDGLAADSVSVDGKASAKQSLSTQFAVIRGLGAAFKATSDQRYRDAARKLYLVVEARMVDKNGVFVETSGKTIYTPWTNAAVSGGLRELMLTFVNTEGEKDAALDLENLTKRYETWFHTVINGGAQRAEWLGDSGENVVDGDTSGDTDEDGVKQVTAAGGAHGVAQVMAAAVEETAAR
jgi:hypothetical protein